MNETPFQLLGVKVFGVSADTMRKLVLTVVFTTAIVALRYALASVVRTATRNRRREGRSFWLRQTANLVTAGLFLVVLMSVWFDDPARLATGIGLVSAGLAFALQKVVTSIAGYFVIIRSRVFSVGECITMGGVRGDVISLDFLKTTLMEMGDPTPGGSAWVRGRQYTGRIVTVTNDKIFEEPIFNSTRDFPFIWDEMQIPITYAADRKRAEAILLAVAQRQTADVQRQAEPHRVHINDEYHLEVEALDPRVYYRITDNWLELSLRFLAPDRTTREIKDRIAREILEGFEEAGIGIASTTIDIVAFPPVRGAHITPGSDRADGNGAARPTDP